MAENSSRDRKILKFIRPVNGISVEQRRIDGFINGTAMCVAHSKDVSDWLVNKTTFELLNALSRRLGFSTYNYEEIKDRNSGDLSATRLSRLFPEILTSKRGAPNLGGGVWIHPKLAVHLAQWSSPDFALLVSDWIEEWLTAGRNPIQADWDQQYAVWQQRHDIRVFLKDFLRPELMDVVVLWAQNHKASPIRLAAAVHDAMNERIQGMKSQQIKALNGLPLSALLRDFFEAPPLVGYAAINKLAKNAIEDRGVEPIQAVHEACDSYFGLAYTPKPLEIAENLYVQGRRLKTARNQNRLIQGKQLSFWDQRSEAS